MPAPLQYVVTYLQEVTHVMEGPDTKYVGDQAKEYARNHSLQLHSVIRKDLADASKFNTTAKS